MKELLKKAIITLGAAEALRVTNKVPRVLFWHGVDDIVDPVIEAENFSISSFRDQVSYLRRKYEIISIDEFNERYADNKFNGSEVVLTFDDGYKNNLTVVAPILKQFSIPFTVFVSTNKISSGELFPTSIVRLIAFGSSVTKIEIPSIKYKKELITRDSRALVAKELSQIIKSLPNAEVNRICEELIANVSIDEFQELIAKYRSVIPLNWDEVRELQDYNCTIASHCLDHICCHENQIQSEVKRQIVESKSVIEKEINTDCNYFAYPNGDFTEFSNQCVLDAGYRLGFSAKRIKINPGGGNIASVPRIGVPQSITTFKLFINKYPK